MKSSQSYGNTHTLSWRRTKPVLSIMFLSRSRVRRRRSGMSKIITRHLPFHRFFFALASFAFSCSNTSALRPDSVILAYCLPSRFSKTMCPWAANLPSTVRYWYRSCARLMLGNFASAAGAFGAIAATRTTPVSATVASNACCTLVCTRFFLASASTIPISKVYHGRGYVLIT